MKKSIILLALATLCLSNVSIAKDKVPYTNQGFYTNAETQLAVHFVDIPGIKKSLEGKPPMTVSFDMDDTALFSSQYFHYGFTFGEELGIVFITGRTKHSKAENGTVTETAKVLQKYFNLPEDTVIWYTADTPIDGYRHPKTAYIVKAGSKLHYGDSDDDILSAREAGVRGIRVQRSYSSTNPQKLNGGYGEEVLINSAW